MPVPDPSLRGEPRAVAATEIRSPVRATDFVRPERCYREISPGHLCMVEA